MGLDRTQIAHASAQACEHYVKQSWIRHMVIDLASEESEKRGFYETPACSTAAQIAAHALTRDCLLLRDASTLQTWKDDTPVPANFFAVRSEFDIPVQGTHPTFVEVREMIEVEFANYFLRHPDRLSNLEPREFEETIASLLKGLGFEIELTARTRDGGRDIVATSAGTADMQLLIECKRYRAPRSVGISVVRELHGVVEDEGATKGILVTTGRITGPARAHILRNRWRLEARDLDGIVEWLQLYQAKQIERISRMIREASKDTNRAMR